MTGEYAYSEIDQVGARKYEPIASEIDLRLGPSPRSKRAMR